MIEELEQRLARYPADRYPVQRATAQFHLGVLLTNGGAAADGRLALDEAVELFGRAGLAGERAKALNALGAAAREVGETEAAARAFAEAAEAFRALGLAVEEGAALFNLGLVRRDPDALAHARTLFVEHGARAQAAAAARDLGAVLLEHGDVDEAADALQEALALSESPGSEVARGAAANMLGLARLAAGRVDEAIDLFRTAVAAHPRGVRPAEFAMAKANLALAYEHAQDAPRARLAARQALGVASVPASVAAQAKDVLGRLGEGDDDLDAVLRDEPAERRPAIVREEVIRWAEADDDTLARAAGTWAAAQDEERAEALLGALLELPPEGFERVLAAILSAGGSRGRAELERAAALFHAPQELRVRDTIERLEERRSSRKT